MNDHRGTKTSYECSNTNIDKICNDKINDTTLSQSISSISEKVLLDTVAEKEKEKEKDRECKEVNRIVES